ncbi:MAG: hypothetical protein ABFC96_11140 [Thermoguttaceae bacterium]
MRPVFALCFTTVLGTVCILSIGNSKAGESSTKANDLATAPAKWDSEHRDSFNDAAQVWRLGKDYFQDGGDDDDFDGSNDLTNERDEIVFSGIDRATRRFLSHPEVKPVVQFSCAVTATPYEDALEKALAKGSPEKKLQALAILMRLRAPSSVPLQWKALGELRQLKDHARWQPLLSEWLACFDPRTLEREIQQAPPPGDRYSDRPRIYLWSIRACGTIQDANALSRLTTLSKADHLYTSLAAERSLEDFTGPKANQALAACILGWQYDAYVRACDALLKRDKSLLVKTLLQTNAPKKCRYYQGVFLARCDNPAAVPILCEEVPEYQILDTEMFAHIARLGGAEHRQMIQSLPTRVRPEQRKLAEQAVQQYTKRLEHVPTRSSSP